MGLFTTKKNPCAICGGPTPRIFATVVEGQPICGDCKDKIDLPEGVFAGMTLADFRAYIAYYDENAALRDVYKETLAIPLDAWGNRMTVDMDHRLFRLKEKWSAMVLEPSCLKGFRVLEDDWVLYESSPEGLLYHPSNAPSRAQDLAPAVAQFKMQYQQYEHMREMEKMMQEQSSGKTSSTTFSRMSEPRFTQQVIDQIYVELTLDHPYWGGTHKMECNRTPRFSDTYPDVSNFLKDYNKATELLHTLALDLMSFIDPNAQEIQVGDAPQPALMDRSAPQTPAVVTDPVREIQKYKGLLDSGAITEEEFAAKKKQLLGL